MASNPPALCCTKGVRHEGTPTGKLETVSGHEAYVARPAEGKGHVKVGILYFTDVIGHKFVNAQLMADAFADNGYVTVMPDIMFGDPIPLNRPDTFNMQNWFAGKAPDGKESHAQDRVYPIAEAVARWMRSELGCERIAAVGYCYGAKIVAQMMQPSVGLVDVGYFAHPSFVDREQIEALVGPLSIAAAETDGIFTTELRHESEQILLKKSPKQPYQITLYSGVEHGFAVRGDLSKPEVKFGKEQAFIQAITWFDYYLLKK